MGQAMHNWNKYWKVVLNSERGRDGGSARKRYENYMREIKREIEKAEREEKRQETELQQKRIDFNSEEMFGNNEL